MRSLSPFFTGRGLGALSTNSDSRRVPLTRRFAPTSPRKRGEVITASLLCSNVLI